jgi:hypothetical protein
MKRVWLTVMLAAVWCLAVPTGAQIPQIKTLGKKAASAEKKAAKEATFTEEEERLLGADISAKLRARYGVVPGSRDPQVRQPARHAAGAEQRSAEAQVDVHRARHRRHQCVRRARRLHPHYARSARAHSERV